MMVITIFGCASYETYVPNSESMYDMIPIKHSSFLLIFRQETIMGDYMLKNRAQSVDNTYTIAIASRNISTYNHEVFNNNERYSRFMIIRDQREIALSETTTIFSRTKDSIRIFYNNRTDKTFPINYDFYKFATFTCVSNKNIEIVPYESQNKNNLRSSMTMHSGYQFFVDGEEYGILTLYPVAFYLKKNNILDNNMATYIFMTYAAHMNLD